MGKIKVIALFGKSGSGKDTISEWMVNNIENTHKIISCTTRPKRQNEEEGKDYYFLTDEDFAEKIVKDEMLEATCFRGNFYGTPLNSLNPEKINIGVFDCFGVQSLLDDSRLEVIPVYIFAPDKTRLIRSLQRENIPNCHEICQRFFTDEEDFKNIEFDFEVFLNEDSNNCDFSSIKEVLNGFDQSN